MTPHRIFKIPAVLALLGLTLAVRADLAFVLTPASQSSLGSNEVYFSAALTNTASNSFLNNIQITFTNADTNYLGADTNVFFANVPGILLPGETYTDLTFGITIASNTPPGKYCGTVTLQGGTNIFDSTSLSSQDFQICLTVSTLGIAVANTNIAITWPSPPGGYSLQVNSDLSTTNWVTVTNLPTLSNGLNQVNLPLPCTSQFYRLEYP